MSFTSKDINNKSLREFLISWAVADSTRIVDDSLVNVYDTNKVIKIIEAKIRKHRKGTHCTKYIPKWQGYIKELKGLAKMTPEEFRDKMKYLKNEEDPELAHVMMDDLIVKLLIELGYEEGAKIFKEQEKWYA